MMFKRKNLLLLAVLLAPTVSVAAEKGEPSYGVLGVGPYKPGNPGLSCRIECENDSRETTCQKHKGMTIKCWCSPSGHALSDCKIVK